MTSVLLKNVWRAGHELRISDSGHVILPGFGVLHTCGLGFTPSRAAFPTCWVMLRDSMAAVSDEVMVEGVLYTRMPAQSGIRYP